MPTHGLFEGYIGTHLLTSINASGPTIFTNVITSYSFSRMLMLYYFCKVTSNQSTNLLLWENVL